MIKNRVLKVIILKIILEMKEILIVKIISLIIKRLLKKVSFIKIIIKELNLIIL